MAELQPGAQLGQYSIIEQVGQGGMATIFRARQEALGRDVAVKVLPAYLAADPEYLARFRREANAIAQLQHPNILPVFDFGERDGLTYIVMLLAPSGQTLRERLGAPVPLATAVQIMNQVGGALHYAHEQGIVHRDVKPSNVLMGERDWALLSDFGIARMVQGATHLTRTGVGIGTPEYMSPEQGQGLVVDGRADQYSLAVILYQMLTGQLPFSAETPVGTVIQHITKPVPAPRSVNPNIPPEVEAVLLRALAKDPAERYPTTAEFVEAVNLAAAPYIRPGSRATPAPTDQRPAITAAALAATSMPTRPGIPAAPTPVTPIAIDPSTQRRLGERRGGAGRIVAAVLVGVVLCGGLAIGGGFLGVSAMNGSISLFAAASSATPTVTRVPTTATATATRPSSIVSQPNSEPTETPTPEPTATETPVPTETPRPTNTVPPRPTNTTAPQAQPTNTTAPPRPTNTTAPQAQPTNTTAPPRPTNTAPTGPGGGGGGIGTITVRNTSRTETLVCSYNGPDASTRLEIPPGGSDSASVPAGTYTERCVTESGAGPGTRSVNVPAGGTVSRSAP
ncbi:MAG: protein kinase [Dehalococcoidia bacterium]